MQVEILSEKVVVKFQPRKSTFNEILFLFLILLLVSFFIVFSIYCLNSIQKSKHICNNTFDSTNTVKPNQDFNNLFTTVAPELLSTSTDSSSTTAKNDIWNPM